MPYGTFTRLAGIGAEAEGPTGPPPSLVPLAVKIGWIWAGSYLTKLPSTSTLAKREADTQLHVGGTCAV